MAFQQSQIPAQQKDQVKGHQVPHTAQRFIQTSFVGQLLGAQSGMQEHELL